MKLICTDALYCHICDVGMVGMGRMQAGVFGTRAGSLLWAYSSAPAGFAVQHV